MTPPGRPERKRTVLARGLRCRCPACGEGRVFTRWFTSHEACPSCGFRFERGPGHWIGGSEINLLVTYPFCVVAFAVPAFVWGGSWPMAAAGGVLAGVMALGVHRPARGVFFAIDYLIEPRWDPGEGEARGDEDDGPHGGGDDGRRPPRGPAPPGGGRRAPPVPAIQLPVPFPSPRVDAEPHPEMTPDSVRS